MKDLSLSRTGIASHCGYFLTDEAVWFDLKTSEATVGTVTHQCAQALGEGRLPNMAEVVCDAELSPSEARTVRNNVQRFAEWAATKDRGGWVPEPKVGYDLATGRAMRGSLPGHRDYSDIPKGWIRGQLDLVYPEGDDTIVYVDYKTGFGAHLAPPAENMQFLSGGLIAARVWNRPKAKLIMLHVAEDSVRESRAVVLGPTELLTVHSRLQDSIDHALANPTPNPGAWCQFCPAKAECPATQAGLRDMVDMVPLDALVRARNADHRISLTIKSDDHLEWQKTILDNIKKAIPQLEAAQKAYTDSRDEVRFADGRVYRAWDGEKRSVDLSNPEALAVLDHYGIASCVRTERSIGIGDITTAMKGAKNAEVVFHALDKVGALTKTPTKTYDARKPKPLVKTKAA